MLSSQHDYPESDWVHDDNEEQCQNCHAYFNENEMQFIGDKQYCPECFEDEYLG